MPQPVNALTDFTSSDFSTQDVPGAINGIPPGPGGPIRPGHPYNYQIKNGKIFDSAGVAVSPESLENGIMRAQQAVLGNLKQAQRLPMAAGMSNFANHDIIYGIAAMQKTLDDYRKMSGR